MALNDGAGGEISDVGDGAGAGCATVGAMNSILCRSSSINSWNLCREKGVGRSKEWIFAFRALERPISAYIVICWY